MAVITVSRQVGSGSEQIATRVAELLGYRYFDKRLMTRVAAEVGLSENEVIDFSETHYKMAGFLERLFGSRSPSVAKISTRTRDSTGMETLTVEQLNETYCIDLVRTTIRKAYEWGNVVILGRGGQAILQAMPGVFHIRIEAPLMARVHRIQAKKGLSADESHRWVVEQDRKTAEYLKRFFGIRWDDPMLYHLVINTEKLEPALAAQFIVNMVTQKETTPVA